MSSSLHSFRHDAMNSPFEMMIIADDENYARSASVEIFREIDRLELLLSRFIENSDLARIAAASPGESVVIMNDTMQCLLSALWVHRETGGAFDISKGQGLEKLILDAEKMTAGIVDPLTLDLGGIGKGFVLDRAAGIIEHWKIENALLTAGPSTVLAMGQNIDREWSIGVNGKPVNIRDQALSASGKDIQGEHIIDPVTGEKAQGNEKAWVICPSAAVADALSTAFMVMSRAEVEEFCSKHEEIEAYILTNEGEFVEVV